MVASILDDLVSLRQIQISLKDQIDSIENFCEQLASVSRVHDDYEVVKKYPEWKDRLKAALFAEVTDSIEAFSTSLLSLEKVIQHLEDETPRQNVSATHESDVIKFIAHLKNIYEEYSNFIQNASEEFTKVAEGRKEKAEIRKRNLYEENFEIRSIYQRLKEDFKKLVVK